MYFFFSHPNIKHRAVVEDMMNPSQLVQPVPQSQAVSAGTHSQAALVGTPLLQHCDSVQNTTMIFTILSFITLLVLLLVISMGIWKSR